MKNRKTKLLKKLWELNIPQKLTKSNFHFLCAERRVIVRRHSLSDLYDSNNFEEQISNEIFLCPREIIVDRIEKLYAANNTDFNPNLLCSEKFVLDNVKFNPEAYAKFLKQICLEYENMCSNCNLLEKLCNKILRKCHPESNITGCNIHKSLFMSKILNYDIIKVFLYRFSI